jgi:hypothetical protein
MRTANACIKKRKVVSFNFLFFSNKLWGNNIYIEFGCLQTGIGVGLIQNIYFNLIIQKLLL